MAADEHQDTGFRVDSLLRAARHVADLSQRDLADRAGVDRRVVSRLEAGPAASPRVDTLLRLLVAAGIRLVAVTTQGELLEPRPYDEARDAGMRRWPAHLKVREVRTESDWWFSPYLADMRPLPLHTADWLRNTIWWRDEHSDVRRATGSVTAVTTRIALVGDRTPAYPSHREVDAVIPLLGVSAEWVRTDSGRDLGGYDGIWLMPGSPYADDAYVYEAITYAREHSVPFLGTCGGLQYAVVEYFRQVIGVVGASHAESDGPSESNVVTAQACSLFGEEREVLPVVGTRFAAMAPEPFVGMHYCNFAPSREALAALVAHGWVIGATAQDAEAEVLELPGHPYFMLSLFQPQIGSLAGKPLHPMLREFVRCAEESAAGQQVV